MKLKYYLYIVVPLLTFIFIGSIQTNIYKYLLGLAFLIIWFYVGYIFPQANDSCFESFLICNSLLIASLFTFIIKNVFSSFDKIKSFLDAFSIFSSTIVGPLIKVLIPSINISILEYVSFIVIGITFSVGYIISYKLSRKTRYTYDKRLLR